MKAGHLGVTAGAVLSAAFLAATTGAAHADLVSDMKTCSNFETTQVSRLACTRLIELAGLERKERAKAYYHRAQHSFHLAKYDDSVSDLEKAIELDPDMRDVPDVSGLLNLARGAAAGKAAEQSSKNESATPAVDLNIRPPDVRVMQPPVQHKGLQQRLDEFIKASPKSTPAQ